MKKTILMSFIVGITLMFASWAMAGPLLAPTGLECIAGVEDVCCTWNPVEGATKYSLDVSVLVTLIGDACTEDYATAKFSFGTSDREDDGLMGNPNLCVPIDELVYNTDCDVSTLDQQLSGESSWRVKALDPGKGKGRQNNPFSEPDDVLLP